MAKNNKNFKGSGADFFLTLEPTTAFTDTSDLIVNPTFQSLIPPLTEEEYAQLEENLQENGIREAISIWGNTIIDGHNRYEIAKKHNLTYATVAYDFDSEDDVKLWIFKNQMGRRNLPPFERVRLALHLKPVIAEKAKLQQTRKSADFVPQISAEQNSQDSDDFVLQISAKQNPMDTRKIIADISGVSHDTVSKVEKILEMGTPETLEKIKRGDITVNKAYQETRTHEKDVAISDSHTAPPHTIADTFSVIYADPPWESKLLDDENDTNPHSIKFADLKKFDVPTLDDAVLLLWSHSSTLDKALQIINAWGFKYQTSIIWDKQQTGQGQYVLGQHETLLIGTKGNFNPPAEDVRIGSVYSENCDGTKPKWFYEQIERMFPNEKYLELFASYKHNDRWTIIENPSAKKEANAK